MSFFFFVYIKPQNPNIPTEPLTCEVYHQARSPRRIAKDKID